MDTARVYFDYDEWERLWQIRALTLECHLNNVTRLVERWAPERAYLSPPGINLARSRERLIEAARIHDLGKRTHFQIEPQGNRYRYSYRGHRFMVTHPDPYVHWLARLHHEYSVDGITEAVADLSVKAPDIAPNFALDLYTLEMCDQIEAEAANHAMGEEVTGRVFMEFTSRLLPSSQVAIDPYPFSDPTILLTLEYALISVSTGNVWKANDLRDRVRQLNGLPLERREVVLCPWT